MKKIKVTWVDSSNFSDWMFKDHAVKSHDLTCKSIGYLVAEDQERIILCNSFAKDTGALLGVLHIPKCAIKKMAVL